MFVFTSITLALMLLISVSTGVAFPQPAPHRLLARQIGSGINVPAGCAALCDPVESTLDVRFLPDLFLYRTSDLYDQICDTGDTCCSDFEVDSVNSCVHCLVDEGGETVDEGDNLLEGKTCWHIMMVTY
jgi:hypothetical protein